MCQLHANELERNNAAVQGEDDRLLPYSVRVRLPPAFKMEIKIGDKVIDRLNGQELEVTDIFTRDGVLLVECTDNHGATTTILPKWIMKV